MKNCKGCFHADMNNNRGVITYTCGHTQFKFNDTCPLEEKECVFEYEENKRMPWEFGGGTRVV